MPPKRKKVQEPEAQADEPKSPKDDTAGKTDRFGCSCGKWYGSLAAVHTHINNKHNRNESEKKEYKRKIINPKKIGQAPSNSIRMKDIQYPEDEAELMCHADITLKNIFETYTPNKDILIDVNEDLSDSDSELEEFLREIDEKPPTEAKTQKLSRRKQKIDELLDQLHKQYKLESLPKLIEGAKELESFTISKFKLNLIKELSKFFKEPFASKVEFSLQVIHAMKKRREEPAEGSLSASQLEQSLSDVWEKAKCPDIKKILLDYYTQWNEIRFNFPHWKEQQGRKEREEE